MATQWVAQPNSSEHFRSIANFAVCSLTCAENLDTTAPAA